MGSPPSVPPPPPPPARSPRHDPPPARSPRHDPNPGDASAATLPVAPIAPVLLQVRDMHVEFGSGQVLRGINLEIPRGETLVIIGESGCGKTVFLKTLVGLVNPTRGQVLFDGHALGSLNERELTRQRLRYGFVFQQAALFDSLNIFENVAFALREHGQKKFGELSQEPRYEKMKEKDIAARVKELVREVGLSASTLEKFPSELSGGMRKRVGLARALALNPEVMLYDEPTTGLDPIMSDVINELILRTARQHSVTSVVVTHDMKSALKIADRVVMFYPLPRLKDWENQIIFDGTGAHLETCADQRVAQFVQGEARDRLMEMANNGDKP